MFQDSRKTAKMGGGTGSSSSPDRSGGKNYKSKENERHFLESLRVWDVVMPPVRKYMVGGYLVPGVKNVFSELSLGSLNKKRRITLELYKKVDLTRSGHKERQHRKVHKELLEGFSISSPRNAMSATSNHTTDLLDDDDMIIFRIMKPVSACAFDRNDDDDQSVASVQGDLEAHYLTTFSVDDYGDGYDESNTKIRWKERYRAKLQTMEILNTHGRTVEIQMGIGEDTVVRDFSFYSIQQANMFIEVFQELRRLQRARGMRQAVAHGSGPLPEVDEMESGEVKSRGLDLFADDDGSSLKEQSFDSSKNEKKSQFGFFRKQKKSFPSKLNILVEVVSASNLPIAGETIVRRNCTEHLSLAFKRILVLTKCCPSL